MGPLGDLDALLNGASIAARNDVELGPALGRPETFPAFPTMSADAFFLNDSGQWQPFKPNDYQARTLFTETTMAFTFSQQSGMILLCGPSGASEEAHKGNQGGADAVVFPAAGAMELWFLDEKATRE